MNHPSVYLQIRRPGDLLANKEVAWRRVVTVRVRSHD